MGAEGVQDGISVVIGVVLGPRRSGAPAKFPPALRVELDQVVQDAEPDLLQAGALSIQTDSSQCIFKCLCLSNISIMTLAHTLGVD